MFLERVAFLNELNTVRVDAAAGQGCVVLVSGEAGIGKTTLVERFVRHVEDSGDGCRVLWGGCDALFTPRPLGPLLDIARQVGGPLRALVEGGADRDRLFTGLLAELARSTPQTLAVFEDVHWADEATLDLLKYVGRRIRQTSGVMILTFRDDEVDAGHPLQRVLGELPTDASRRLKLPPLSEAAVARLATAAGREARDLHGLTGGNPFYVTEVLAADEDNVPASVRDAVLARAGRLGSDTRNAFDLISIVPGRIERWLLETLVADAPRAIELGVRAGMLRATSDTVAFRHELARRVWEDRLEPGRAVALHGDVLRALGRDGGERMMLSRFVHHAERCGDGRTVRRLAPLAAREAATFGAHREAAAHYESALRHADTSEPAERAELLDAWSYELHLVGRIGEATSARKQALALWAKVGDRRREGDALRWLSRLAWFEGRRDEAASHADNAIRLLEPLGPSHELAMACSTRAQLHILREERAQASEWGDRAIAMAEELDDPEALVHALTNAACLEPGGLREMQVRAVRLAQQHGFHEHALRAYTWLICDTIQERNYAPAERFLEEALAYAAERDIDTFAYYLRGWRARMRVEQGRLEEAENEAADLLSRHNTSTVLRLPALAALGTVLARRGDPGAEAVLDEALESALSTGEPQRIVPVAAARAEAAWLRGDAEAVHREVMRAYATALELDIRWEVGRLAAWLHRAGVLDRPPPQLPAAHAAEIAGRWEEAAREWDRLGCPFERALALGDGHEGAQREALTVLEAIGARPAAALLRRRMRRRGMRRLPRGPRSTTRANVAGLTDRQTEVLALLIEGLTNRQIADRLFLSSRTVDHHVAAVLEKLGVESRQAAASVGRKLGIGPDRAPTGSTAGTRSVR